MNVPLLPMTRWSTFGSFVDTLRRVIIECMGTKIDTSILSAALLGYQTQLDQVNRQIRQIRARLGGARPTVDESADKPRRKHLISAEGRARIAEAQRKRWADMKKTG